MLTGAVRLDGLDLGRLLGFDNVDLRRPLKLDDVDLGSLFDLDMLDLFNLGAHRKKLGNSLGFGNWGNDDSIFLVHALVSGCNSSEMLIGDIELLIDTMKECLAEWSALVVTDDAVK
jgi:hypothetical protein